MAKAALSDTGKVTNKKAILTSRKKTDELLRGAALGKKRMKKDVTNKASPAQIKRRDALVMQYMPYASSIASRICHSLSVNIDYDEVLCNARLGLLEAAKRFDEGQDVDFRTFSYYRIKGAVFDGLRRSGWLPRTLYAKVKFEEAANEFLQHQSLNNQSVSHLNDDSSHEIVQETVNNLASIYIISYDANEDLEIEDTDNIDIEQHTEFLQIRRHMRDAISSLPEKEKQLVMMYYFQNKTFEEIGIKLGLSKSWTSRLHSKALSLLFKRIRQRALDQPECEESL